MLAKELMCNRALITDECSKSCAGSWWRNNNSRIRRFLIWTITTILILWFVLQGLNPDFVVFLRGHDWHDEMGRTKQTPNRLFVSASLLFLILELGTEERWVAQQVVKVLVMLVFDGPANCLAYNTLVMPVSEGCLLVLHRPMLAAVCCCWLEHHARHPNEKALRWFLLGPFILYHD